MSRADKKIDIAPKRFEKANPQPTTKHPADELITVSMINYVSRLNARYLRLTPKFQTFDLYHPTLKRQINHSIEG